MNTKSISLGRFGFLSFLILVGCPSEDNPAELSISETQKYAIWSMTTIAENSRTTFDYSYAENIGDGRGITFGIIGFTSGTYDGTELIRHIQELEPTNPLVNYLPAFEAIDNGPHDEEGLNADTTGLEHFIEDFNLHGDDPFVKQAQLDKLIELYWDPAVSQASEIGVTKAITMGELYDACVNHGSDGDGGGKGLKQLIALANTEAGGTPGSGVDEIEWLKAFLDVRLAYLNSDPVWQEAVDRVGMYERLLATRNYSLEVPFDVTCYGDAFTIDGSQP